MKFTHFSPIQTKYPVTWALVDRRIASLAETRPRDENVTKRSRRLKTEAETLVTAYFALFELPNNYYAHTIWP